MSVSVLRGAQKGAKEKIVAVQRNKKDKANGGSVYMPFYAHDLEITALPSKAAAAKLQRQRGGSKQNDLD